MEDFVHLHVHTHYSILDGQAPVARLVDKAVADGMRGMAITDHGNMFGVKELFDYCTHINAERTLDGQTPFKPIFGCEMYVARRSMALKENKDDQGGYHLIVLAKNLQGYHNLVKLVSHAWTEGFYSRPRTDHNELEKYHEGLIVCSACVAGEVPKKILQDDIEGARKAILWHKNIWGDDYYLELQRHKVTDPNILANRETFVEEQKVNAVLIRLAQECGVKLICTNDSHFVDEDDAEAHDHLLCVNTGADIDDPNRLLYTKQEWFKTRQEMNDIFADIPQALRNTCEILDKVDLYDINHDPIMPFFPIPTEFGSEEEWRTKYTPEELIREFTTDENGENPLPPAEAQKKIEKMGGVDKLYRIKLEADYLRHLTYQGATAIYGEPIPPEVDERIRFELHVMKTMGFPGYFLIVQDFINEARHTLDVRVGPGRGSAAGSVVAYCLGITRIDPLRYNLLFERFLNPDRISLPDIDTDFDDEGRGRVLQWVIQKYGAENCAHIITYSTMKVKNALKDVARVEHVPYNVANAWTDAITKQLPNGEKENFPNVMKYVPQLQEAETSPDPRYSNTIKYARKLEGTVRGTGIHACGFIISRDPITDHVPVSTATDPDFPTTKTTVTQYEGDVIESMGLIKMDFLGLRTLSEQKEAVKNIKLTRGIDLDLDHIPIDDPLTYELFQRGQTVGTFQFESAGMQKYLRELHPTCFEDLIAMNALYRPGPMDNIPQFIRRKNGQEEITYDLPIMEQYLRETYGITVYQEQVMLLSRLLAGFTRGESDSLRKAMGKKKKRIVDQMKPKFIEGGTKNGHDPAKLEKIWADWEKFASYAFNKSHAACYSWVAYQTAYLKAHYPSEFMAAIMTCRKDDIKKVTKAMQECVAMNINILGPDVNESFANFGVNSRGEIRFGLAAIKGMGEAVAEAIINERTQNGPYESITDFVSRVNLNVVNRKSLEALAVSGALDCFSLAREQYMEQLPDKDETFIDVLLRFGSAFQITRQESANSLFGFDGMMETINLPVPPKKYTSWSAIHRLNLEKEMIGIYLSAHPLDDYIVVLQKMCSAHPKDLANKEYLASLNEFTLAGIVTSTSSAFTKTNKPYGIVKIEDFDGEGELTIFDNWADVSGYFTVGATLYIKARCAPRFTGSTYFSLSVVSVAHLHDVMAKNIRSFTIQTNSNLSPETAEELVSILHEEKGDIPLFLEVLNQETNSTLLFTPKGLGIMPRKRLVTFLEENQMGYDISETI